MRLLVTGAEGFLGRHIAHEFKMNGHSVLGIDRGMLDLLEPTAGDALVALLERFEADYVLHLAAKVGRLFGEEDPIRTIMDNAGITATVARACAQTKTRLAYASTSEVYGDLGELTAVEDGPMRLPHNLYGLTKRHGEEIAELYAPRGLVCLRFSMPYGPGHPPGRGRAALTNIIHQALAGQTIPIHRGAERSWCWVGDTARAVRVIITSALVKELEFSGAWNVGRDDNALPLRTVAEMACDMAGAPRSLIRDVDPPGRQTVVKRLSTERLYALGWRPKVELEEGMGLVLAYVQSLEPSEVMRSN